MAPFPSRLSAWPRPGPLVAGFLVLDVVLVLLNIGAAVVAEATGGGYASFVRLGQEGNLPTWVASVQLLLIGLGLAAVVAPDVSARSVRTWPLALFPALFVVLSLDEAAMIHERMGDALRAVGIGETMNYGPWQLVAVPIYGGLALAALRAARTYLRDRREPVALLAAGFAVLGGSAVGLELAQNIVAEGTAVQRLLSLAEESGELVGATLLLWAVVELLRLEGVRLVRSPAPGRGAPVAAGVSHGDGVSAETSLTIRVHHPEA